jgi:hypothetical protein
MHRPRRFLNARASAADIVARFSNKRETRAGNSYATVRDYCESLDELKFITGLDGDLKNVQRPWIAKAIIGAVPPPARILEIGGGEPIVSGFLRELGYDVTLVDPYDGGGNGPTEYDRYIQEFPDVNIVRSYFGPGPEAGVAGPFDAIFSVSVLEHLAPEALRSCFDGVAAFLKPNGASIHCFDFILQGPGEEHALGHAAQILAEQERATGETPPIPFEALVERLRADVETFFLSPQGHHHWRGGLSYDQFPFRKVVSLETIAFRQPSA